MASDLVKNLLWHIDELGCINYGETPLNEIAAYFYKMLGVSECQGKLPHLCGQEDAKNDSRSFFYGKMQEKENRRMDLDEERVRIRR